MTQKVQDVQDTHAFKQTIVNIFTTYFKRKIADELDQIEKLGGFTKINKAISFLINRGSIFY